MFECWGDDFAADQRRVVDPPTPVLVNLSIAIGSDGPFRRDEVSLRVKVAALDLTKTVPGLLYAWAQTTTGGWLGLCGYAIPTGNGHGRVETRQWTPARALSRPDAPRQTRPFGGSP
ncbi:hypothetical protein [Nocardia sp.]|uniref:hypothetical protein n=1 Tax=Nocardia sp. TaxID=1821 RepID=UPI002609D7F9|nr:hypothetical protein [Nocardia sp.]